MNSRERVTALIEHRTPDRIPIYGWLRANLEEQLTERFGSVEAFEDRYEFDLAHVFGGPSAYWGDELDNLRAEKGGPRDHRDVMDLPLHDVNQDEAYDGLREQIDRYQAQRGRFCYVQTPGIFEATNRLFGIENHLMYMAQYPEELHELYRRRAEWNRQFAMNCLDLGVDMIHVSDDWGAQRGLMFSPRMWREMIFPYHKVTTDAVKARGAHLSLHSDGNVMPVLDGIVDLGYQVVHPYQVSAGMDLERYVEDYRDKFSIMGGIDIQSTLGFGDYDRLRQEIVEWVETFRDGELILCTTHFVQDHCSIDELVFAYDLIYELVRANGRSS